jgi:hypothetical protein
VTFGGGGANCETRQLAAPPTGTPLARHDMHRPTASPSGAKSDGPGPWSGWLAGGAGAPRVLPDVEVARAPPEVPRVLGVEPAPRPSTRTRPAHSPPAVHRAHEAARDGAPLASTPLRVLLGRAGGRAPMAPMTGACRPSGLRLEYACRSNETEETCAWCDKSSRWPGSDLDYERGNEGERARAFGELCRMRVSVQAR